MAFDPPLDDPRFAEDYVPEALSAPASLDRERSRRGDAVPPGAGWEASVARYVDKEGNEKIAASPGNLTLYLTNEPGWSGCLGYNEFSEREVWLKAPPAMPGMRTPQAGEEVRDEHDTYVQHWFHRTRGFNVRGPNLGIAAAARANSFHPVRAYLRTLEWDGKVRLRTLLSNYFGAGDTEYAAEIGARWALSAVARVERPGCQADSMLIIEGRQGEGKSTGLETLVGKEWFADTPLDLKAKADAYQALRGKWVYEIAELDAFRGQDITRIKTFVSARVDNYRASYGRRNRDYPRQTVFAGSTNEKHYLHDRTGNRRFWPFKVEGSIRLDELARDRDQLWAEALVRFDQGMAWHIDTPRLRAVAEEQQEARMVGEDPWLGIVLEWLERPTVPTAGAVGERTLLNLDEGLTTADVLLGAIGARKDAIDRRLETRMGVLLHELGFEARQTRVKGQWEVRCRRYFKP